MEERRRNEALEKAAASTQASSEKLISCNQELKGIAASRDSLQMQLTEKQRLIEAYEGRDEACYVSLQHTKVDNRLYVFLEPQSLFKWM